MNKRFLVVVLGALALLTQVGVVSAHREAVEDDEASEQAGKISTDDIVSEQAKDEEFLQIPQAPNAEVYTGPKDFNYCKILPKQITTI